MIRILGGWDEIGVAVRELQLAGLPLHETPQKNWDHWVLWQTCSGAGRGDRALDLGCGDGFTLRFLDALGFRSLLGLDLEVSWRARLERARWRFRGGRLQRCPYRLRRRSMVATGLPAGSQALVTCVSAVEHGVRVAPFMAECARILGRGGLLFLTTDYWEPCIEVPDGFRHYGQPWVIFDRARLEALVEEGARVGLRLLDPSQGVPPCIGRPAVWQGREYTFACVVLRREP